MRNYGIDLLRLVLMFMVCMLHTLGQGGVLSACAENSVGYYTFWLFEVFSYCAVDGFALISGYTAKDKPQKYAKIVEMWFQAFFYSFVVTIALWVIGLGGGFSLKVLIKAAMPVTFGLFWYFTAYFALFFAIPILNRFLFETDEDTAKKALIILVVLFSGLGVLYDPFKAQGGYSAIWLMALYCIGVLAKRGRLFEERKTKSLALVWALSVVVTWATRVFLGVGRLTNYMSPTILLNAMIMVVVFSRIRLRGKFIGKVAPLAFGVYLFQLNSVLWQDVLKGSTAVVVDMPLVKGILIVFAVSSLIFASGLIVEFVRGKMATAMRIPVLSKKLVDLADCLLEKLFVFIK